MFLTRKQLQDLTGRERKTAQIRWLRERGFPYELDADGCPKVLVSFVESRLGGKITREPQLRLAG